MRGYEEGEVAAVAIYFCAGSQCVCQCYQHSHLQLINRDRIGDGQATRLLSAIAPTACNKIL